MGISNFTNIKYILDIVREPIEKDDRYQFLTSRWFKPEPEKPNNGAVWIRYYPPGKIQDESLDAAVSANAGNGPNTNPDSTPKLVSANAGRNLSMSIECLFVKAPEIAIYIWISSDKSGLKFLKY